MGAMLRLRGKRFARLTVVAELEDRDRSGHLYWFCRCACRRGTIIRSDHIVRGEQVSCGCYRDERTAGLSKRRWRRRALTQECKQ